MNFILTSVSGGVYKHYSCSLDNSDVILEHIPELDPYQGSFVFVPAPDFIMFYLEGSDVLYRASLDFSVIVPFNLSGHSLLKGGIYDGITGRIRFSALTQDSFDLLNITWAEGSYPVIIREDISSVMALTGAPHAVYYDGYAGRYIIQGSARSVAGTAGSFTVIPLQRDRRVIAAGPEDMFYTYDPYSGLLSGEHYITDLAIQDTIWNSTVDHGVSSAVESYDHRLYIPDGKSVFCYDRTTGNFIETYEVTIDGNISALSLSEPRALISDITVDPVSVDMGGVAPVTGNNVEQTLLSLSGAGDVLMITVPSGLYISIEPGVWITDTVVFYVPSESELTIVIHPYVKTPGRGSAELVIVSGRTGKTVTVPVMWQGEWQSSAELPIVITSDTSGIFDKSITLTAGNGTIRYIRLTGTFV